MTTEEKSLSTPTLMPSDVDQEVERLRAGIRDILKILCSYGDFDTAYYRVETAAQQLAEAIFASHGDIGERVDEACWNEYREWRNAKRAYDTKEAVEDKIRRLLGAPDAD